MKKCKKCGVPLSGILSKIPRVIARVRPSEKYLGLCNKCEPKGTNSTYLCQICGRQVDEASAISHVKAEEYLLGLIKKDHPEWKSDKNTCHECIDYYRALINKAKI